MAINQKRTRSPISSSDTLVIPSKKLRIFPLITSGKRRLVAFVNKILQSSLHLVFLMPVFTK